MEIFLLTGYLIVLALSSLCTACKIIDKTVDVGDIIVTGLLWGGLAFFNA